MEYTTNHDHKQIVDPCVSASNAVRHFSSLRKQAKHQPIIILDKNKPDSVILSYEYYEKIVHCLQTFKANDINTRNKKLSDEISTVKQQLTDEELLFLGIFKKSDDQY